MTALSAGSQRVFLNDPTWDSAYMAATTTAYQGSLIMLDASGRATVAAAGTGNTALFCVGCAMPRDFDLDRYDNSTGGTSSMVCWWKEGMVGMVNDTSNPILSTTVPGTIVYAVDDNTVSLSASSGTSARPIAGRLRCLDTGSKTGSVIVMVGKAIGAQCATEINGNIGTVLTTTGTQTISGTKTFASGYDPVFVKEADHNLTVATSTTTATVGGALALVAGIGTTTANGGAFSGAGGAGGATSGNGGAASLRGGAGGTSAGTGGATTIAGGAGTAASSVGGALSLQGGTKGSGGTDGAISIGTANGSAITIASATGTLGFFGKAPVAQAAAYTLTYSTVRRICDAITSNTIVDSSLGTPSTSSVGAVASIIANTGSAGAAADYTSTAAAILALRNAVATLAAELVLTKADLLSAKKNTTALVTDLQGYFLVQ